MTRILTKILKDLSTELDYTYTSISYGWINIITKDNIEKYIIGYEFGLNSTTTKLLMDDKSGLDLILSSKNISNVNHILALDPKRNMIKGYEGKYLSAKEIINQLKYPVVCKPNSGVSGKLIFKVNNDIELDEALSKIWQRERGAAICKYYNIKKEYRVIVLDDEVILIYEKIPENNTEVKLVSHKLSKGAYPDLEVNEDVKEKISKLALTSTKAINSILCSVDIINTDLGYMVLEINNNMSFENFGIVSDDHYVITKETVKKILSKLLNI